MAPTIYEDDMAPHVYQSTNRVRQHCSVINYVGHSSNRDVVQRCEVSLNEDKNQMKRNRETSDRRNIIKRYRRETRIVYDSDESSNSIPSPMTFHNYAKRRRFSQTEDESENYISSSSESDDRFVTSTVSFNDDSDHENGRIHAIDYSLPRKPLAPLAPYSPVSSTTGALTIYRRLTKATPQYVNPFYRQDLMEIAMKTIILLQKNRSLHARLLQLKLETRDFVNSVMSNPENAKLRETLNQSNEKTINHSPSKILAIKNQ